MSCQLCQKPSTLGCPKCQELGLEPALFCSQECFTKAWPTHKKTHKKSTTASSAMKMSVKKNAKKSVNDGEVICAEGDPSSDMFIILKGSVISHTVV